VAARWAPSPILPRSGDLMALTHVRHSSAFLDLRGDRSRKSGPMGSKPAAGPRNASVGVPRPTGQLATTRMGLGHFPVHIVIPHECIVPIFQMSSLALTGSAGQDAACAEAQKQPRENAPMVMKDASFIPFPPNNSSLHGLRLPRKRLGDCCKGKRRRLSGNPTIRLDWLAVAGDHPAYRHPPIGRTTPGRGTSLNRP
jgi:hypothetical protein